ncbi:MAG: HAMP domain-containing histidine kinase [Paraburkholderia sp.]|uniref:sensor histidine kinase n=1 Tax=Paraburkholderia sp. TaxID=1926495 RepID=UPI00120FD11E|nr:HAMP domain-containing sensor histidine kinase [Paraburkholderia sp.]TAL91953.1 MAG: HAMP domain-containing histidine kinase [Paraburkholderia sp.]
MTTFSSGTQQPATAQSASPGSERTAHLCAEAALFMRDHVLSLVSHDLRSPLNAIHSWAYVLERKLDAGDATAQRAITGIRGGVEQQVKLLESLVDATRAETKSLALDRAPFALAAMIDATLDAVRTPFAQARAVTVTSGSALAGGALNGDAERLAQALWLMLTFAIESSARETGIVLESTLEGTLWQATVTWTPAPAALDDPALPHLLEAFARRQAQEPREAGRIAWVLALCKRVAEAHGGKFEQHEATLVLRIPLAAA